MPYLKNILKLITFFNISIDFLFLLKKTSYPESTSLITFTEKIDKLDKVKRFQIESTAETLIGKRKLNSSIKLDNQNLTFTNNIHKNLKLLRENKELSQKELAQFLGVTDAQISLYENKQIPPAEKLVKLSELFNTSIHALLTGIKLNYNKIGNFALRETVMKADKILPLKEKSILLLLMQRIIEDSE